ncbi:MAG: hypothetical protein KQJ78_08790 [Deltaproteobacteria bacterium]|nr:hypothetical protein [Deltaproteobacteria bacterium]
MPRIEFEVSDQVYRIWQAFGQSQQAERMREAGVTGDWAVLGLMHNVERYLKEGGPRPPEADQETENEKEAAQARRRLTKSQKRILPMFNENDRITLPEMSRVLGLTPEQGAEQLQQWVDQKFLAAMGERDGETVYGLSPIWLKYNLAANRPSLNAPRILFHLRNPNE